jgi:hypothetical protein
VAALLVQTPVRLPLVHLERAGRALDAPVAPVLGARS